MNRAVAPEVKPFGPLTMPAETVEVLANGLTLHVVEGGDQPVSRLSIAFSGGVSEIGNVPAARLLVSQIVEGTSHRDGAQIADILDFNGARFGAVPHGHNVCADLFFLNDRAEDLMSLWADCIVNPVYPEDRFETARLSALSAFLSSQQEVASLASAALGELMYGPGHPLGRPLTEEIFKALDAAPLRDLHRRLMCPARIHAFLSGRKDRRVGEAVRRMLLSIPSLSEGIGRIVQPMRPEEPQTRRITKEGAFQDAIAAGMPGPDRSHSDYIALRLTVMALGGYFGSRLMLNIREEKGLTYGINAALMGTPEGSMLNIAAQCDGRSTDTVINEIGAEMRRMVTDPPAGEELRRLKLHASTDLAEILDTPTSIMGYYANRLYVGTPDDYFERQQKAIETLSPDIISEMAARYLDPSRLTIVTAGS